MNATTGPVLGDQAAATVASTGIPVLLLADHPGPAVITTSTGGDPQCYTTTTATYEDGLRAEVHAPADRTPRNWCGRRCPVASALSTRGWPRPAA
ncbi:hypothetical protein ACFQ2M_14145 [Kitasatospora saccharophila]|uniref:hypothetical protein n=1 Tax=Kitasatospora saccharophila TaxID=407973 RepID=UPI003639E1D0